MRTYYASKLSENISRTPEGYLICKNVHIDRTGVQEYLGDELGLEQFGDEMVPVYREEEEVFSHGEKPHQRSAPRDGCQEAGPEAGPEVQPALQKQIEEHEVLVGVPQDNGAREEEDVSNVVGYGHHLAI